MERVLVLGATSAIAGQVARIHAARGDRLHLVGRNADKLAALVAELGGAPSGNITSAVADLALLDGNQRVVAEAIAALGTIDRVVVAHGLLSDQLATERAFTDAEPALRTNFLSVVSLLIPLANHLEQAGAGRMGVITSVAGDRGRPRNYTYGAAKGALNVYLQGLRSRLYGARIAVTTIKLGPVDTPMTTAHEKNSLFATPEKVAHSIVRAIDRRAAEVYVPSVWAAIMLVVRNLPESIFQKLPFLSGR